MGYYDRFTQRADNSNVTGTWTGMTNGTTEGSTRNNRGIIRGPGSISSSLFVRKPIAENNLPTGMLVYNTSHLTGSRRTTGKAVDAGSFATMTAGSYVVRRITTTLAGVANTVLRSGGSDYGIRRSIHRMEQFTYSFLYGISWSAGTASLESPGPNHPTYTFSSVTTSGTDSDYGQNSTATNPASQSEYDLAARPTITAPGQLVYKGPKPNPVLDLYKTRSMF